MPSPAPVSRRLRPATVEEFLSAPAGRYAVGGNFAFWCDDTGLTGVTLWGRATEENMRELSKTFAKVLESEVDRRWPQRISLMDASTLTGIDGGAFEVLDRHFRGLATGYGRRLVRQATVRPGGIAGSVIAGFFDVVPSSFPSAVFTSLEEALKWLGRENPDDVRMVEELRTAVASVPSEVAALRCVLATMLTDATLEQAAHKLAVSPRTLQRRLQDAGTNFQVELNLAQIDTAKRLLSETDTKLTVIALDVGCSSLQHFSRLFRSHTNETPSAFRQRIRGTSTNEE